MNKSILLIDKDPAIIDVIQTLLDWEGYEVIVSIKPFNIGEVKYHLPSLILLHNGLDNLGSEICKELKTCPDTKTIPIIMTSTRPDLRSTADECGADAQVQKPFDINYLVDLIKQTIRIHRK